MSSGRIRFGQIDGLKEDTQANATEGEVMVYDEAEEEFDVEENPRYDLHLRRVFLLMGG